MNSRVGGVVTLKQTELYDKVTGSKDSELHQQLM